MKEAYSYKTIYLADDGIFPNNKLPVILYKSIILFSSPEKSDYLTGIFEKNNWKNSWKNGVYDFHHYHSNTHEVLGAYNGKTKLLFGGENGKELLFEEGDVLIIPAGVAHKNISPGEEFSCVGAYPDGRDYDMNYGKRGERPKTDSNILSVPLPLNDPVFGHSGALLKVWE